MGTHEMSSCDRLPWCSGLFGSAWNVRSAWSWSKKSRRPGVSVSGKRGVPIVVMFRRSSE